MLARPANDGNMSRRMRIPMLGRENAFPSPEQASPEGIVAFGGEPSPERLLLAYASGIFPWPHKGLPLLWFSPNPRFVVVPERAHVPTSLRKRIRRGEYEVRVDTAFRRVMEACSEVPRPGQGGTWINAEMIAGYTALHELGFAHSIESWQDGELVGGLYGVSIGRMFTGESMFARAPDASKVAFVTLLGNFAAWGFSFVDCEVETPHLARFGGESWPRRDFLAALSVAVAAPSRRGAWSFPLAPLAALERLPRG
ncbi:Leucyl/phenylalanyl-tRNA--protein transferase [Minicystis rosea]|nr:Leucyl/phenylalanyl-tRNA--protein transferase [Minicystis rosea]